VSKFNAWRLLGVFVLLGGAVLLGVVAYSMGVSAGMSAAGSQAVAAPYAWGYAGAGFLPWFLFWPIAPLLFFLFIALIVRLAFGGGGRPHDRWYRYPGHGPRSSGPEDFEAWHRRAHEGPGR
jgi:hypothetical protein